MYLLFFFFFFVFFFFLFCFSCTNKSNCLHCMIVRKHIRLQHDILTLSMRGKNFSRRHFETLFFLFFPENRLWNIMQIVLRRQFIWNVKVYFLENNKKSVINLLSANNQHVVYFDYDNGNVCWFKLPVSAPLNWYCVLKQIATTTVSFIWKFCIFP